MWSILLQIYYLRLSEKETDGNVAALRESLLTLGYRHSYHTIDAITFSYYDCKLWDDLLKRKEAGEKVTREEFDQILGHCQVSHYSSHQAAQSGSGGIL